MAKLTTIVSFKVISDVSDVKILVHSSVWFDGGTEEQRNKWLLQALSMPTYMVTQVSQLSFLRSFYYTQLLFERFFYLRTAEKFLDVQESNLLKYKICFSLYSINTPPFFHSLRNNAWHRISQYLPLLLSLQESRFYELHSKAFLNSASDNFSCTSLAHCS